MGKVETMDEPIFQGRNRDAEVENGHETKGWGEGGWDEPGAGTDAHTPAHVKQSQGEPAIPLCGDPRGGWGCLEGGPQGTGYMETYS